MRLKIIVSGIVQGVGFRPFVYRIAVRNNLRGYVRNRGDSCVEIVVDGEEKDIKSFLRDLVEKKPPLARIHEVVAAPVESSGEYYGDFKIFKSSGEAEVSGSIIPPDIAICDECLMEMRNPSDLRYDYFFITCVNCGPRYTIIEDIPYDRENTTMRDFQMCSFCRSEYVNPANRRFHAQTIACPRCGPKAYLTDADGLRVDYRDPIREAGKLVSEGYIVAVKGYGGFHLAASTLLDEPLKRLRAAKHRRQKPFAIMARSLEAAKSFAKVSPWEERALTSYARPIVLLEKGERYYLSELVSPGLHNVGVMLPYTGLHYMLFDQVSDPAFVMTSANPPNQPIIKDEEEAFRRLRGLVDYFLLHDRRIAHRCDDSVLRMHGDRTVFIRRSRGYAPEPVRLKLKAKRCALGLGGEENNTVCLIVGDKAFLSQHIGDVENLETLEFLESASMRLMRLTNSRVDVVSCDLHPKFATTMLAKRLSEEHGWRMFQIQHHYAHTAALMAEHGLSEIIAVCCDGYGYGEDGGAWGGEIVFGSLNPPVFKRLGCLEEQPLLGGDLATKYPLRMAAGILYGHVDVEGWLLENSVHLPYGLREAHLMLSQFRRGEIKIKTTSCGRVLDAASAVLGVCYERTYEGEPAMKLESAALHGEDILKIEPQISGRVLNTTEIMISLFEGKDKFSRRDLAYSIHVYLARGLAELAMELAVENNVKNIGFTGGVACNQIITEEMRRIIEQRGLNFFTHDSVPPGDGGLSLGQAVVASIIEF
ncbi:MAG: carbamoyltransferase HypF [Candidatus Bathyarchaeota archaeon]|nr:carbamoyltransferase HypF [Candidatus Bathyarchaeota archaeon]